MPDGLAQACTQFEAVMLKQMLTEAGVGRRIRLDNDVDDGGSLGDDRSGATDDMLQSMFADALAQAVAGADRAGLGHALENSLRVATP
jgi:hypothetical protein